MIFLNLQTLGLYNKDNRHHVWLGIFLFIDEINDDLFHFQQLYNNHSLRTEGGQTPFQLFFNGMHTHGVRGLFELADDQGGLPDNLELAIHPSMNREAKAG